MVSPFSSWTPAHCTGWAHCAPCPGRKDVCDYIGIAEGARVRVNDLRWPTMPKISQDGVCMEMGCAPSSYGHCRGILFSDTPWHTQMYPNCIKEIQTRVTFFCGIALWILAFMGGFLSWFAILWDQHLGLNWDNVCLVVFFSSQIYKILYYYKRCVICFIVCFWYTLGPPWEWNMYSIWKHVLSNWQCLRTYSWQLTQSRHKDWIAWARLKCVCWGMLACPKHTDIKYRHTCWLTPLGLF